MTSEQKLIKSKMNLLGCQGPGRFPRLMVGYMSPPFLSDVVC